MFRNTETKNKMEINNSYIPTFGAIKISNAKLRKILPDGTISRISASITELSQLSKTDRDTFEKMYPVWADDTEWFSSIYENFQYRDNSNKFIAIEENDLNLPIEQRIKSLISFTAPEFPIDKTLCIRYIQSAPGIANNKKSPIRGAGELALFEAIVQAAKHKINRVQLYSSNHSFYERLGLTYKYPKGQYALGYFEILKKEYENFIRKIEEKYDFKHE